MVQNILTLIIVFAAAAISIYSVVKSLVFKKGSKCDGCAGCEFKKSVTVKTYHPAQKTDFKTMRIAQLQHKHFN